MEITMTVTWVTTTLSPLLLLLLVVQQLCWGQENNQNQAAGVDYETYNQPKYADYNYGGGDYGAGDYGMEPENLCYVCHYTMKDGHGQGFENCRDPFDRDGIPMVDCPGPCSKKYYKLGEKEYDIHRMCTPNCKEMREPDMYIECCSSRLCNGAQGSQARNYVTGHLVTIATAICLVLIFHFR